MALTKSKRFYLYLNKYGKRDLFPALGNKFQNFLSVVHFCEKPKASTSYISTLSKAMKLHLEKAEEYDKFMKQQFAEYELGKKFLANMMGQKVEKMTEEEIDEAIEYLFPSALFVSKAKPLMKPPDAIFSKQKQAVFDESGRPFHFLFYTCKPHFSQLLHDAAVHLENLNRLSLTRSVTPKPLSLLGGSWFTKEELESCFMEKLYDIEYEKFLVLFERLSSHPYAITIENFIKKYWKVDSNAIELMIPEPITENDDVKVFKAEGLKKKTATGEVMLTYPGTGKIKINNLALDYFQNLERRQQVGRQSKHWKKKKINLLFYFSDSRVTKKTERSNKSMVKLCKCHDS